jgi:hypothetical protein
MLERFLSHPIFWGAFAVVTLSFALGGKLSVTIASGLMWVAYCLAVYGVYLTVSKMEWSRAVSWLLIAGLSSLLAIGPVLTNRWYAQKDIAQQVRQDTTPQTNSGGRQTDSTQVPHPPAQTPAHAISHVPKGKIHGRDNTIVGTTPIQSIDGDGNTVVGATDAHGNTILNSGGVAIGSGAVADPTSIAIGAHANAGSAPSKQAPK